MKQVESVLILGDANSPHVQKWATAIEKRGISTSIFSLNAPPESWQHDNPLIKVWVASNYTSSHYSKSVFQKLGILSKFFLLLKIIRTTKPTILHAHYASSYGLLGALTFFRPYIVSVWGMDVYDFPRQGLIQKLVLRFNLSRANMVFSTSEVMKLETQLYTNTPIAVTPFGVDLKVFGAGQGNQTDGLMPTVIGTIKSLSPKYGIDDLIRSFAMVCDQLPQYNLKLLLVGGGAYRSQYETLVKELNIAERTTFTGLVSHKEVPGFHQQIDIFLALSTEDSESFGVSVVEASASGKPVIVSAVGGLPEVVEDGVTGFVLPKKSPELVAKKLNELILNPELAKGMGNAGRTRVKEKYDWELNMDAAVELYTNCIE